MTTSVQALATILAAVDAVSELTGSTGMSVGGKAEDPTSVKIPLPAAWVLYAGKAPGETPRNGVVIRQSLVGFKFIVMIYLPNAAQSLLISTHLPVLDKVIHAIHGVDSSITGGFRFQFEGERLVSINAARLVYEQRYSFASTL